jgi:SOS-response transcriptional repressor LexA
VAVTLPPGDRTRDRQRELLDYIIEFQSRRGHAPSYAVIGRALGGGKSTIAKHIRSLERQGFLKRHTNGAINSTNARFETLENYERKSAKA